MRGTKWRKELVVENVVVKIRIYITNPIDTHTITLLHADVIAWRTIKPKKSITDLRSSPYTTALQWMTNFSNQRFGLRWDLISAGNSNWIQTETFFNEINCISRKKLKRKKQSQNISIHFRVIQALSIKQKCTDIDSAFQEVSLESYPISLISWTWVIFCLPHLPFLVMKFVL